MTRFDELTLAVREAKNTIDEGDSVVRRLSDMVCGRLKIARIDHDTLCELKRELQNYNMRTGEWK